MCKVNIYIRNLSPWTSLSELRGYFEVFGEVKDATICTYQSKGESRCLGFMKMPINDRGHAAIAGLQGKELDGNLLQIEDEYGNET